jgi:3-hydroxyacyl-[acyl-carrier-protein] dehydratase
MLLNSLYTIVECYSSDNDLAHYSLSIDPKNGIYKGHFPGFPVTPGVVEIEIVKELVEHHLNQKIGLSKISNCKFINILNPEETSSCEVKIEFRLKEPSITVLAVIFDDTKKYLNLKAEFALLA